MDTRFWWRALDAPTPRPVASQAHAKSSSSAWNYPSRRKTRSMAHTVGMKLEVPRGDRRYPARHKAQAATGLWALFIAMTMVSGIVAALVGSGSIDSKQIQATLTGHAVEAFMALGFGVDQISVTGHHFTSDSEIFDALDLPNVRTFAEFDAEAALKRIERLPWIETAQITRVFPGSLTVQVRERRPTAIWDRGDKSYLIDSTGRVLGPIPAANTWPLPHVAGEGANGEAAMLLTALARHNEIHRLTQHSERIAERRWAVVLKNTTRLELGADRESEGLDLIESNSELRQALAGPPAIIDVRTPGRAVVRPFSKIQLSAALVAPLRTSVTQ